ncbi:MAG TPA: hypothetical protein VKA55_02455, partial [Gammaproteobacteria bacterium]|nr:hypothetical protein [Gammaproteobacteria bacterium]
MTGSPNTVRALLAAAGCAALVAAGAAAAQDAPAAKAPAPAPKVDSQQGAQDLEKAYKREFAFLEAQKKSLQKRLDEFRSRAKAEKADLEQQVDQLKDRAVRLNTRMETLRDSLQQAEERVQSNSNSQEVLEATFTQAGATLGDFGYNLGKGSEFAGLDNRAKAARLFTMGNQVLERVGSVRRSQGSFFLADGTKTSGTLVKVGQVATYGISDQGSGVLAPAGGGALKLWNKPASDAAEALAKGNP